MKLIKKFEFERGLKSKTILNIGLRVAKIHNSLGSRDIR